MTAIALGLCASLSGCFLFTKMKWDPGVVKAGKKTTAVISMTPETSDTGVIDRMVPFVIIGVVPAQATVTGVRTFDVKGKFGGPTSMFADATLRAEALSSDDCGLGDSHLSEIQGQTWTALRTDDKVNDRDKTGKTAIIKVGVKTDADLTEGQVPVYVFAGNWSDQGPANGAIDDGEVVCNGGSISNFTVKP